MTTQDQTRTSPVDPLVLTAPARAGQRIGALAIDVFVPIVWAALAGIMFVVALPLLGWIFAGLAVATLAITFRMLGRSGRSFGRLAAGTRTVRRSTGATAGASFLAALVTGDLGTFDIARGRDPLAAALAPLSLPEPGAVATPQATQHTRAPILELDTGQRFALPPALVIGRDPSTPVGEPAELHRWADLSRTLSKSHARFEWDGRVVWVTDLGSTNGTMLRVVGAPQRLLPFQRTPVPTGTTLGLGDRVVTVRAAG